MLRLLFLPLVLFMPIIGVFAGIIKVVLSTDRRSFLGGGNE